jgi:hypothetical protein
MVAQTTQMNGKDHHIVTGIKEVPVTLDRPPAVYLEKHVTNPGVARVNCCPTVDTPDGMILSIPLHPLYFLQTQLTFRVRSNFQRHCTRISPVIW